MSIGEILGSVVAGFVIGWIGRTWRDRFGSAEPGIPLVQGDDDDVQPGSIFSAPTEPSVDHMLGSEWVLEVRLATSSDGPFKVAVPKKFFCPCSDGLEEWTERVQVSSLLWAEIHCRPR